MRKIILAAAFALAAGPALCEPSEYLKGDELQAEVKKLCADGCIVFSPAEVEELQKAIAEKIAHDMAMAYDMGKKASDERCRNKI